MVAQGYCFRGYAGNLGIMTAKVCWSIMSKYSAVPKITKWILTFKIRRVQPAAPLSLSAV